MQRETDWDTTFTAQLHHEQSGLSITLFLAWLAALLPGNVYEVGIGKSLLWGGRALVGFWYVHFHNHSVATSSIPFCASALACSIII